MASNSIAIIPARGGSKRIPKKNVKPFCGIPMVERTIKFLQRSNLFDSIYVSTDDTEISKVSTKAGAIVPFQRDNELADDFTPTGPVILDCLKRIGELENVYFVCCVYPCTPMLNESDLVFGLEFLKKSETDFVYPVVKYSHPVQRRISINESGSIRFSEPDHELTRTQDLEDFFHDSGQFYWGTKSAWLSEKRMHTDGLAFEIDRINAIDIDNEVDWMIAEAIFKSQHGDKCE